MNETIVKNWNSVVDPEDEVYFLGDLAFAGKEEAWSNDRGDEEGNRGCSGVCKGT